MRDIFQVAVGPISDKRLHQRQPGEIAKPIIVKFVNTAMGFVWMLTIVFLVIILYNIRPPDLFDSYPYLEDISLELLSPLACMLLIGL